MEKKYKRRVVKIKKEITNERLGCIYKITCLKNNKVYIGQTVQSPPIKRWIDHYNTASYRKNDYKLYEDINKMGIENFTFQIIETKIKSKDLNEREIKYIELYDSTNESRGYNITNGGYYSHSSKITIEKAKHIAEEIISKPEYTMADLSRMYNVSVEMISDINCGDTWRFEEYSYPIRDNSGMKNLLSKEDVICIYDMLKKGDLSCVDIGNKFNVSHTMISNINHGIAHKYLKDEDYPITIAYNSKNNLSLNEIKQAIISMLEFKDLTYKELASKINFSRSRKTLGYINSGSVYKNNLLSLEITKFPIKDNYYYDEIEDKFIPLFSETEQDI